MTLGFWSVLRRRRQNASLALTESSSVLQKSSWIAGSLAQDEQRC
ncbi:hypothetical protein LINGRAPRIM_LOCUS580 [Linum grandiflorum]